MPGRGQQHQQADAHHESRHGIPHEDHHRCGMVDGGVVADGLDNAQGNTDAVSQNQCGQAIEKGDRQAFDNGSPDRFVVARRASQIELHQVAHPVQVTDQYRLVEAVVFLELHELLVGQGAAADPGIRRRPSGCPSWASCICRITRSTGPPGTKRVTAKTSRVMPMNVGMTNRSRRMKYDVMGRPRGQGL